MRIAILGAGLAGIELGRRLKESGQDFVVLEKESQIGGICRTNRTGEYYWDFAVHAMYSRSKEVMDYFYSLPLDYKHLNRNVKIFHSGRDGKSHMLSYPFEIGIKDLPLKEKLECIGGCLAARLRPKRESSDLQGWIDNFLGRGIAKYFMIPYNNKIWSCDLTEISHTLASSKIDPAPVMDLISSALGRKIIGRAYQASFLYPKRGIQELVDHAARDIQDNIHLNSTVERLIRSRGKWTVVTEAGAREEADIVISTIPTVELIKKVDISGLKKEYDAFKWNNTFFIMVGLKEGCEFQLINDCHWVFFKEDEIFYRVTLMHNFGLGFPPALVAEITQKGPVVHTTEEEMRERVIQDLREKDIIASANEIARTDIKLLEHTYPIPTVGVQEAKEHVHNALGEQKLYLLGRSGNWDYINMDGVILNVKKFFSETLLSLL